MPTTLPTLQVTVLPWDVVDVARVAGAVKAAAVAREVGAAEVAGAVTEVCRTAGIQLLAEQFGSAHM